MISPEPPAPASISGRVLNIPRWRSLPAIITLAIGDVLSISLAGWLTAAIFDIVYHIPKGILTWNPIGWLNLVCLLLVYTMAGLYPAHGRSGVEEIRLLVRSATLWYGLVAAALIFLPWPFIPWILLPGLGWLLTCLLTMIMRMIIREWVSRYKWWPTPVILVGASSQAQAIILSLAQNHPLGFRPVLLLDEGSPIQQDKVCTLPVVQQRAEMLQAAKSNHVHHVLYIEPDHACQEEIQQTQRWLGSNFHTVLTIPASQIPSSLWIQAIDLQGLHATLAHYPLLDKRYTLLKRVFDLLSAAWLGLLVAPLFLLIALIIRLDSPGPILYAQERVGLDKKRFRYYKFRTMVRYADEQLPALLEADPAAHQEYQQHHKLRHDPRVTRAGKLLRKFSLDELPQLWNVLRGEMSLVGPRAYLLNEYPLMGTYQELLFRIRPGITGWWQVMGRHSNTFQHRLQLDEYYLNNWSPWLDLYILLKTSWVWLSSHGV